jgi:hypothetical protein
MPGAFLRLVANSSLSANGGLETSRVRLDPFADGINNAICIPGTMKETVQISGGIGLLRAITISIRTPTGNPLMGTCFARAWLKRED